MQTLQVGMDDSSHKEKEVSRGSPKRLVRSKHVYENGEIHVAAFEQQPSSLVGQNEAAFSPRKNVHFEAFNDDSTLGNRFVTMHPKQ